MSSVSPANTAKYTFQLCGYQTCQKRNLTLHEQAVHQGKTYQCQECLYQATQKGSLFTHQKSVHMGQKFQCPVCEYQATGKGSLVSHKKSLHMCRKFQCPECEHLFTVYFIQNRFFKLITKHFIQIVSLLFLGITL